MAATNINRVVLTGNLTRDPELRSLPSGMSVCSLRLASNTRRKTNGGDWEDKPLGHEDPAFTYRTYVHLFRAAQQARAAREQLDADFGHLFGGGGVRSTPEIDADQ